MLRGDGLLTFGHAQAEVLPLALFQALDQVHHRLRAVAIRGGHEEVGLADHRRAEVTGDGVVQPLQHLAVELFDEAGVRLGLQLAGLFLLVGLRTRQRAAVVVGADLGVAHLGQLLGDALHQVDRQGGHARRQLLGERAETLVARLAEKIVVAVHGARVAFHRQAEPPVRRLGVTGTGRSDGAVERGVAIHQAGAVIEVDQLRDLCRVEQLGKDQEHFQAGVDADEVAPGLETLQRLVHVGTVGLLPARLVVHQARQWHQCADIAAALGEGLLEQFDGACGVCRAAARQHFAEQSRRAQVATGGQGTQVLLHWRQVVLEQRVANLFEAAGRLRRPGDGQGQGQGSGAQERSERHGDLRMSSAGAGRA